jgi:hypothetical protein
MRVSVLLHISIQLWYYINCSEMEKPLKEACISPSRVQAALPLNGVALQTPDKQETEPE